MAKSSRISVFPKAKSILHREMLIEKWTRPSRRIRILGSSDYEEHWEIQYEMYHDTFFYHRLNNLPAFITNDHEVWFKNGKIYKIRVKIWKDFLLDAYRGPNFDNVKWILP